MVVAGVLALIMSASAVLRGYKMANIIMNIRVVPAEGFTDYDSIKKDVIKVITPLVMQFDVNVADFFFGLKVINVDLKATEDNGSKVEALLGKLVNVSGVEVTGVTLD